MQPMFLSDARLASQTVQSCILAGYFFQLNDTNWACCLLLPYCYLYASALREKRQVAFHYDARRPWHAWPQGAIFVWFWLIFWIDRLILNFDLGTQQFWCGDMSGTCDPSPTQTRKRDDFTGFVGLAFVTQLTSAGLFQKLASNCRITWKHTCSFEGFKLPRHKSRKIDTISWLLYVFSWNCRQRHPQTQPKF